MRTLFAVLMLGLVSAANASPVQFVVGSGSTVGVAYGTGFSSYLVSGVIFADVGATSLTITGGALSLVGPGPDTSMTITAGQLSHDGSGFFWDFGQGPFDAGVPAENPGYVLDDTGFTGTLGDMFGNFSIVSNSFDAEGFGLADDPATHSMSSFFWSGGTTAVVPVPAALWLMISALAGLGLTRVRS